MKAATTISHHDSRTSRAKRGDKVVSAGAARATTRARRRGGIASFLLKNISLRPILHAVHYTPGSTPTKATRRAKRRKVGSPDGAPTSITICRFAKREN